MGMKIDWDRRHCARHGHATYAPDEPALRERLRAETGFGEAWRCLRCGDFVLGEPHGSGPADHAPLVPRGKVLRDLFILRFLAIERAVRGVFIVLVAAVFNLPLPSTNQRFGFRLFRLNLHMGDLRG